MQLSLSLLLLYPCPALPPWSSSAAAAAIFALFFAFFFARRFFCRFLSFLSLLLSRSSRRSMLLFIASSCLIIIIDMLAAMFLAATSAFSPDSCFSISFTIAPAIEVRSLFLLEEFFVFCPFIALSALLIVPRGVTSSPPSSCAP